MTELGSGKEVVALEETFYPFRWGLEGTYMEATRSGVKSREVVVEGVGTVRVEVTEVKDLEYLNKGGYVLVKRGEGVEIEQYDEMRPTIPFVSVNILFDEECVGHYRCELQHGKFLLSSPEADPDEPDSSNFYDWNLQGSERTGDLFLQDPSPRVIRDLAVRVFQVS